MTISAIADPKMARSIGQLRSTFPLFDLNQPPGGILSDTDTLGVNQGLTVLEHGAKVRRQDGPRDHQGNYPQS